MSTGSVNSVGSQSSTQTSSTDAYSKLNAETFLKLLVTELSNQDPLEPMNSEQIINQISQIRSIQASTELTTTLEAVLLGQNVATASGLLGRTITGLTDDSQTITGQVDRVSVVGGEARLQVGDSTVSLKNVSEILPAEVYY